MAENGGGSHEQVSQLNTAASAPVTAGSRIASLDLIRGIAILGILAANIVAYAQPPSAYMWPDAFLTDKGPLDPYLWFTQFVLIDGKMRGLFTLLFGAGLYLFMERAWARGQSRWLQFRRLCWLLVFGLIHFFLIWRGDILMLYAVMGILALACLRWSAKLQLITGILGYILGGLLWSAILGSTHFVMNTDLGGSEAGASMREALQEGKADALAEDAVEAEILTNGSYADYVAHNISEHGGDPLVTFFMFTLETLPLILIGMALYRYGLFSGGLNARKQRLWGWAAIGAGAILTGLVALWALQTGLTYYATLTAFLGFSVLPRLAMVVGLAAILALWGANATGWLAERLSAAGRVAFTNYLGTSVVMLLIFHPWAGGLWGTLNRLELYLVVALGWAMMLAWSWRWLENYRYGPLEWFWRCLTYWRWFPLKR